MAGIAQMSAYSISPAQYLIQGNIISQSDPIESIMGYTAHSSIWLEQGSYKPQMQVQILMGGPNLFQMTEYQLQHIVIYGNPIEGYTAFGPFDSDKSAISFAERHLTSHSWSIVPLNSSLDFCPHSSIG